MTRYPDFPAAPHAHQEETPMTTRSLFGRTLMTCALGAAVAAASLPASALELMLIADDEKITWDEAGKPVFMPPGKDHVLVVDIGTDPLAPQVLAMSIRALIEPAIRGVMEPVQRCRFRDLEQVAF